MRECEKALRKDVGEGGEEMKKESQSGRETSFVMQLIAALSPRLKIDALSLSHSLAHSLTLALPFSRPLSLPLYPFSSAEQPPLLSHF